MRMTGPFNIGSSNLLIFLVMTVAFSVCDSKRILVLPFAYHSHVAELLKIASGLHDNGHEIYVVLPPSFPGFDKVDSKFKVIGYEVKEQDFYSMPEGDAEELMHECLHMTPAQDFRKHVDGFIQLCTNALGDENLYKKLKSLQFDLALVDAFPNGRCNYVLVYRLGIPFVSIVTCYESWVLRNPSLPSHAPFLFDVPETIHMDFWQRLRNTYLFLEWTIFPRVPSADDSLVSRYAPDMPYKTLNQLAAESLLWLVDTDVAVDFPRPLMPNEINIGGLSMKPAGPLPQDLVEFLEKSPEDAILVSFGSMDHMPPSVYDKLMAVFKQIKQQVIWRYNYDFPEEIPANLKLMKWVPQNDILGHPKVKLFLTHGGANGQFESVYHGVPVMTFPLFGDQDYNALRAKDLGFGITIDLRSFTDQDIVEGIGTIFSNSSFADEAKKRSDILRSREMSPQQRAVFWVEHVMKYGGKHLHCSSLDMPWYQYLMLDIIGFAILVVLGATFVIYKLITYILNILTVGKQAKAKRA